MEQYNLTVSNADFAAIWVALGERPAREVFATMLRLQEQIVKQEQEAQAPKTGTGATDGKSDT